MSGREDRTPSVVDGFTVFGLPVTMSCSFLGPCPGHVFPETVDGMLSFDISASSPKHVSLRNFVFFTPSQAMEQITPNRVPQLKMLVAAKLMVRWWK